MEPSSLTKGTPLPEGYDFKGKFIYYVGLVDLVGDEVVGPLTMAVDSRGDSVNKSGPTLWQQKIGIAEKNRRMHVQAQDECLLRTCHTLSKHILGGKRIVKNPEPCS